MKKLLIICLIVWAMPHFVFAQHSDDSHNTSLFSNYQDSLVYLGYQFINAPSEPERMSANYQFIRTLVKALKAPNSFLYPFDSVKYISILNAPDNRFRVFSWHIMNSDGSYRFFGAIQMNTGGPLRLFPLEDYTAYIKNPEDTITDNRTWYGAQYYKIIKVSEPRPYYVLLGWKGSSVESTKRVIEVLSFKNDKPQFGMAVFDNKGQYHKRIIFEYTREVSMLLRYVPEDHLIVFDHLVPPNAKSKNKPETYGPDLTYNGYRLKDGKWQLVEDLDMRNEPTGQDDQYIDPKAGIDK